MSKIKSSENFVKTNAYLGGILLHYFNMNKTVEEAHKNLRDIYNKDAFSEAECRNWFLRFKNGDFNIEDKEQDEMSEENSDDEELEKLFEENTTEAFEDSLELVSSMETLFTTMGMVLEEGRWVTYELKPREIERRFLTCELLLQRQNRKNFLNRIVVGDERWIYYNNINLEGPSSSVARSNIGASKVLLCIWWDEKGVIFYQILKPDETITVNRYLEQLMVLASILKQYRPEWSNKMHKIILMHEKSQNHMAKSVNEYIEAQRWEVIHSPPFSPDLFPSEYHLFKPLEHSLSQANLGCYEDCKSWIDAWLVSQDQMFFHQGIHVLPEKWAKIIASDGKYYV